MPDPTLDMLLGDISPDFTGSSPDEIRIGKRLIALQETPRAALYFAKNAHMLGDYSYWFLLGVLWVSYSGFVDLTLWRRLLSSPRRGRHNLMKPSELAACQQLGRTIQAYRAHREGETDWISYTLDPQIAARFARERGRTTFTQYTIDGHRIVALFLRRREQEVLVLDRDAATAGPEWTVKSIKELP
jgi:hypothetical protein